MIKVAIVEDEEDAGALLRGYLERFERENAVSFGIDMFSGGTSFLFGKEVYDVVFLDIDMPGMNGLEVSHRLREADKGVGIVFVTNLKQYAIRGYEVDALDFVVKPVTYYAVETVMKKILRRLRDRENGGEIIIRSAYRARRILVDEIAYVDIYLHNISLHLKSGETEKTWGSLAEMEAHLPSDRFVRCSSHCVVNLALVRRIDGFTAYLEDGTELPVSRSRKNALLSAFARRMG